MSKKIMEKVKYRSGFLYMLLALSLVPSLSAQLQIFDTRPQQQQAQQQVPPRQTELARLREKLGEAISKHRRLEEQKASMGFLDWRFGEKGKQLHAQIQAEQDKILFLPQKIREEQRKVSNSKPSFLESLLEPLQETINFHTSLWNSSWTGAIGSIFLAPFSMLATALNTIGNVFEWGVHYFGATIDVVHDVGATGGFGYMALASGLMQAVSQALGGGVLGSIASVAAPALAMATGWGVVMPALKSIGVPRFWRPFGAGGAVPFIAKLLGFPVPNWLVFGGFGIPLRALIATAIVFCVCWVITKVLQKRRKKTLLSKLTG